MTKGTVSLDNLCRPLFYTLVHRGKKREQETHIGKYFLRDIQYLIPVLSISFEVDVPTGKVGGSLLFEWRRRKLSRGVWEHAPPENFEI